MALEINNDTVREVDHVHDGNTDPVTELRYGRDKVWPQPPVTDGFLTIITDKPTLLYVFFYGEHTLEYSFDLMFWTKIEPEPSYDGFNPMKNFALTFDDRVYFRGYGNTLDYNTIRFWQDEYDCNDCRLTVKGDPKCLFNCFDMSNPHARFNELFIDCVGLYDASGIIMPTSMPWQYYCDAMFHGCTRLEHIPELPAKQLTKACYSHLFSDCPNLEEIPVLPATELAEHCYAYMMKNTKIRQAPELPATIAAEMCYQSMFADCRYLEDVTISLTTMAYECCYSMLENCTALKNVRVSWKSLTKQEWDSANNWNFAYGAKETGVNLYKPATLVTDPEYIPSGWTQINY